ncbi:MAG: hypothetical protein RDV48_06725 [Candidatus Eremiobacteraeota bacterium]|nr:hypothetical protein [Candidatus Eremiobacteraeota bacterium]
MVLTKKSIMGDVARKAAEITKKMEYCFPDYRRLADSGSINLFTLLYYHELQHRPFDSRWEGRDRVVTTKGPQTASQCAVLAEMEYFGWNQANTLLSRIYGGDQNLIVDTPGADIIASSPDMAMTIANGIALWARTIQAEFKVYAVLDSLSEARFLEIIYSTALAQLQNIVTVLRIPQGHYRGDIIHNWFTLGWHIEEADFQDMESIFHAFSGASKMRGKPTVLIG